MIERRRKLLSYIKKKNLDVYSEILSKLGLRKQNPMISYKKVTETNAGKHFPLETGKLVKQDDGSIFA